MEKDEIPITICVHCRKALTPSQIKLTIRGRAISWDGRQERSDVTVDYCAEGARDFEETQSMTIRNAVNREEELRQMDAVDKIQRAMNKKDTGVVPRGLPT